MPMLSHHPRGTLATTFRPWLNHPFATFAVCQQTSPSSRNAYLPRAPNYLVAWRMRDGRNIMSSAGPQTARWCLQAFDRRSRRTHREVPRRGRRTCRRTRWRRWRPWGTSVSTRGRGGLFGITKQWMKEQTGIWRGLVGTRLGREGLAFGFWLCGMKIGWSAARCGTFWSHRPFYAFQDWKRGFGSAAVAPAAFCADVACVWLEERRTQVRGIVECSYCTE